MEYILAIICLAAFGFLMSLALGLASHSFSVEVDPRIEEIMAVLPNANCGGCGLPGGCMGYARDIVGKGLACDLCGPGGATVAMKIAEIMGEDIEIHERMVAIVCCQGSDAEVKNRFQYEGIQDCRAAELFQAGAGHKACIYGCLGLGTCARACTFDAIKINENHLAVIDYDKCTACGACIRVCPRNIIKMIPASAPIATLCNFMGKGSAVKAVCPVGCTGCGICVKRAKENAIKLEYDLPVIDYSVKPESLDVADFCPQFIIIDLKKYKPAEWLKFGREELKQRVKEEQAKQKADKDLTGKKTGKMETFAEGDE